MLNGGNLFPCEMFDAGTYLEAVFDDADIRFTPLVATVRETYVVAFPHKHKRLAIEAVGASRADFTPATNHSGISPS